MTYGDSDSIIGLGDEDNESHRLGFGSPTAKHPKIDKNTLKLQKRMQEEKDKLKQAESKKSEAEKQRLLENEEKAKRKLEQRRLRQEHLAQQAKDSKTGIRCKFQDTEDLIISRL